MCGICFVCGLSSSLCQAEEQASLTHSLLHHRGPDSCGHVTLSITDKLSAIFHGCVLWLQGPVPTAQPVTDKEGNVLLWNGDILAGYEIPGEKSDTKYISDYLTGKDEEEIMFFLSAIKGPWSLIYYQKSTKRLYFGRDVFGRHSLVWRLPSEQRWMFLVSSVTQRNAEVTEVPALGLYYIDFLHSKLDVDFHVNLIPWNHVNENNLEALPSTIHIQEQRLESPIKNQLNISLPTEDVLEDLRALPASLDNEHVDVLYNALKDDIDRLLEVLKTSIQRRVDMCPQKCQRCTNTQDKCSHSRIAVLFSGGLDSAMIALLLDSCIPSSESVDLLNVAFEQRIPQRQDKKKNQLNCASNGIIPSRDYNVPDRLSGRSCWQQLTEIRPGRRWNFVEIDVTGEELARQRELTISHLVAPLNSVLDDSIGCALWFGGRGEGTLEGSPYVSPARVLLCGMGADEQLAGYSRHRGRFSAGGWPALLEEIDMEISRIHTRNLGRDNRILADHGRAPRFPYLDEDVVSMLNSLPIWRKANLNMPRGVGEKILLRTACARLGLTTAAGLPKRAIQFGSRIAKLENSKEKGSDTCSRLVEN
ncbi:asparagine synthetase domain-containing protein 1-like [Penaeus indicus]|uniref:asparagine synthetase domain-containing protein 1-like n=1 Tax=Penaeus indicus TaxID=29960 RepID=UPI00300D6BCF